MPKPYNPQDRLMHQAYKEGFRARSVYKLAELDEKFHLIKPHQRILDLGAAPGSFLQYANSQQDSIKALGLDLKEIAYISKNIKTKVADITNLEEVGKIILDSGFEKFDLILSDLAPNTTGIKYADQIASVELNRAVFETAKIYLRPQGSVVMKVFPSEHFDKLLKELKRYFKKVAVTKVQASRDRSSEIYVICKSK